MLFSKGSQPKEEGLTLRKLLPAVLNISKVLSRFSGLFGWLFYCREINVCCPKASGCCPKTSRLYSCCPRLVKRFPSTKIEAIMNDFVRLEPQSNMFEAETMIEGTLDGFSFYSDEEGEKVSKVFVQQSDPNNENEGQANKRARGKTEKSLGTPNKKKKPSAKAPKKVPRKSQVAKRTKKSKR